MDNQKLVKLHMSAVEVKKMELEIMMDLIRVQEIKVRLTWNDDERQVQKEILEEWVDRVIEDNKIIFAGQEELQRAIEEQNKKIPETTGNEDLVTNEPEPEIKQVLSEIIKK